MCQTNITRIVENTVKFIDELRAATNESLNASAVSFENILGSLYPITFSCYHSLYEYGEIAVMYGATIADGLQLLYNIIHKLGNIYDCIFFLVRHHKNHPFTANPVLNETLPEITDDSPEDDIALVDAAIKEYELAKEDWWFRLGIYYGTLIDLLLYVPDDYIEINYEEDIDNTIIVNLVAEAGM